MLNLSNMIDDLRVARPKKRKKTAYYGFEKGNFCRGVVCGHLSDLVAFTIDLTTKDITQKISEE